MNNLFHCTVKVRRGTGSGMPAAWLGAYVDCYVAAPDHLSAVRLAAEALGKQGNIFEDILNQKVHQMDPVGWDQYVVSSWTDMPKGYFPRQSEVLGLLESGGAFFGPFMGWESEPQDNR